MVRTIRLNLLIVTVVLLCVGIVMIYSTSSIFAAEQYGDGFYFLKRHLLFLALGIPVLFAALSVDYRRLRPLARPLLLLSLVCLALVLLPGIGREVAGARRWFRFKFISFQPSELANFALITYIADFIVRRESQVRTFWRGFVPPMIVLGATVLLILMQPDLGSSVALAVVVCIMLYVARVRMKYLTGLAVAGIPLLLALIMSAPYRRARIMAFINPWADPRGVGFQVIQSQIALGSGVFFGVGLGHSKQKLFYLPAAHTDFIFSIIGEELGLLGTMGVIVLLALLIVQGVRIIKNTADTFGYFLGVGLLSMLSFKAVINIGVSCGILPTKGLPLPFISYGGSSLIFDIMSIGLLMNIARTGEYP